MVYKSGEIAANSERVNRKTRVAAKGSMRVLMLAAAFDMPYRVLRCLHASGAGVFALGNAGSRDLRFSRYCRQFFLSDCIIHGGRDEALALEINCLVHALGIGMVLPSDAPSTRALIAIRDLIEAPCFPLPSLAHFDYLNDKWNFSQLCNELGIPQPGTCLLPDAATLANYLETEAFQHPVVAKPVSRSGSSGVVILDGKDTGKRLRTINYRPVLVQEFVPGELICAGLYASEGEMEAIIAYRFQRKVYSVLDHEPLYAELDKIVRHFKLTGVYNFDIMQTPDGKVYFLECNPRFFHKMDLAMISGVNFALLGLPHERSSFVRTAGAVRKPKALIHSLLTSGRSSRRDWAMAYHLFSDPVPYLMEGLGVNRV